MHRPRSFSATAATNSWASQSKSSCPNASTTSIPRIGQPFPQTRTCAPCDRDVSFTAGAKTEPSFQSKSASARSKRKRASLSRAQFATLPTERRPTRRSFASPRSSTRQTMRSSASRSTESLRAGMAAPSESSVTRPQTQSDGTCPSSFPPSSNSTRRTFSIVYGVVFSWATSTPFADARTAVTSTSRSRSPLCAIALGSSWVRPKWPVTSAPASASRPRWRAPKTKPRWPIANSSHSAIRWRTTSAPRFEPSTGSVKPCSKTTPTSSMRRGGAF